MPQVFWSLTVLPGGQGFSQRLGAPRDLFEFQVLVVQPGFSLWSFGRAYLELYFDLCFDFLFFNKIYETSLVQEFCVFYSHLTGGILCKKWMGDC